MNNRLTTTIEPWYRHRWPWLLMLGPFVVIVAAAITVYLAVISNDGLVDDDYYKQGLAINQTLARTLLTNFYTMISVLFLLIMGGGALKDFSVAMLVGMITGTYSSIYIATPVTLAWYRWKSPDLGSGK